MHNKKEIGYVALFLFGAGAFLTEFLLFQSIDLKPDFANAATLFATSVAIVFAVTIVGFSARRSIGPTLLTVFAGLGMLYISQALPFPTSVAPGLLLVLGGGGGFGGSPG